MQSGTHSAFCSAKLLVGEVPNPPDNSLAELAARSFEFMLSAIKASLIDAINASDEVSDGATDKATMRWKQIEKFLETHPYIMNADVRVLRGVSAATANRILAGLVAEGKLVKYREGGHWGYKLLEQ